MRWMNVMVAVGFSIFAVLMGSGCATTSYGNQKLTSDNIAQIKKGVTTKAEVIELLGQPDTVGMMGDGRRMMMYNGMQGNIDNSQAAFGAIPIAGALIPEHTNSTMHRQTLQVILTADDIVQDYEYSSNASESDTSMSVLGGSHTETKALPSDDPPK